MIDELSISGYRGFGKEAKIHFAQPNGNTGSGITFMVGANNSGKTSVLEALKFFSLNNDQEPSFSVNKRNIKTNSIITLILKDNDGILRTISTVKGGGSNVELCQSGEHKTWQPIDIFFLQSRRYVNYEFSEGVQDRTWYIQKGQISKTFNRTPSLNQFYGRIFDMQKHRSEFDPLLEEIFGHRLDWTIDLNDNGQYFLRININGCTHTSEGLGDGIWSVFTICNALFDSKKDSVIVIDEPELSLHPAYQKRVLKMLKRYALDRQIIISTHSPYFIDWESISNGGELNRNVKDNDGNIQVFQLSSCSRENIKKFKNDIHQPHTLGLEAKEIFFLEDDIILVEGQEDVIIYPKIAKQLDQKIQGTFFGWGAGGVGKIPYILNIFRDLGYKKVQIIYDGDKKNEKEKAEKDFPDFKFYIIPADDVRDKSLQLDSKKKDGLIDQKGKIKEIYRENIEKMIIDINEYSCK